MDATIKIRRSPDGTAGSLETYTVEVAETATLLDVLDAVKDSQDGSLAYRKSCRMAVCGSCGMRMDGGAVLACKTAMRPLVEAGHVPTISAMGNLPVIKDLVVDMTPFWAKIRAVKPFLQSDLPVPQKEYLIDPKVQQEQIGKEALCIQCGCCVSECNSMEADPEFLGPAALAKSQRFVGDPRDTEERERLQDLSGAHGIWDCTRCYFCNERCPKGVDPRDAIAKLGAEAFRHGLTRDEGARHAKVFVSSARRGGFLKETELVPKTIGPIAALKDVPFALRLARAGKVPNPLSAHKAKDNDQVKRLWKMLEEQDKHHQDPRPRLSLAQEQ
jgi:succinate dehydrogenase / fumarate reductase iron-sulfur subunit